MNESNPVKSAGVLTLAVGVLIIVISLTFTYFNISDNFFTFDLTQVFWVGLFFVGLGLVLWLMPHLVNSRNIALLILTIGIIGIGVSLAYSTFNIADNFLSFDLTHILWLGMTYAVVGFILLFFVNSSVEDSAAKRLPMVREPDAKPEPKQEKVATGTMPKLDPTVYAPRPTPDDLTVIEGIGDKVQQALNTAGIYTYAQLAHMTAQEIYQIVKVEQGVRIIGDTATWSKQAQFLVDGDAAGLMAYQAKLVSGRASKYSK
jgi:predicted flap endonuclease-1-like 5' DNA nuclease